MAFFDDIGRRVTSIGRNALQKVQNFAEISKLNTAVAENQRAMDEAFRQLGKQYMAMHPEDYASEFAGIVTTIAEADKKIKDLHLQIMSIKGVVACPKCGSEAPRGSAFCSVCGTELPRPKEEPSSEAPDEVRAVRRCPACGAEIAQEAAFCNMCGSSLQ